MGVFSKSGAARFLQRKSAVNSNSPSATMHHQFGIFSPVRTMSAALLLLLSAGPLAVAPDRTPKAGKDTVEEAARATAKERSRPEQKLSAHVQKAIPDAKAAPPSTGALASQPDRAKSKGYLRSGGGLIAEDCWRGVLAIR
jgi:hypothetical protein